MSKRGIEEEEEEKAFINHLETLPPELLTMVIACLAPLDVLRFSLTNKFNGIETQSFKKPITVYFRARCHRCGDRTASHKCNHMMIGPALFPLNWIHYKPIAIEIKSLGLAYCSDNIAFTLSSPVYPVWESERETLDAFSFEILGKEIYFINDEEECLEHAYALVNYAITWTSDKNKSIASCKV